MTGSTNEESVEEVAEQTRGGSGPQKGGGAVYGLGLIGAAVWFWQRADGRDEQIVGLLKALVWPAFLVYEAFKALDGRSSPTGR